MPILPAEGPEGDATQAGAHDRGANAAATTEATQGDIAPATATTSAPAPVKTDEQAEMSDALQGKTVIGTTAHSSKAQMLEEVVDLEAEPERTKPFAQPLRRIRERGHLGRELPAPAEATGAGVSCGGQPAVGPATLAGDAGVAGDPPKSRRRR